MKPPQLIAHQPAIAHCKILLDNYHKYFHHSLVAHSNLQDALEQIWEADFVLLSHGTEADPIFNFGNLKALQLFELDYKQFITLASRHSAEFKSQAERDTLLAQVTQFGYVENYTGLRISATGKKFMIKNAKVWNLFDEHANYYGQAAMFQSWQTI